MDIPTPPVGIRQSSAKMTNDWTPLARAIFERDVELARKALDEGADPNANYTNLNYVELATYQGVPDVLDELLKRGGRVELNALHPLGEMDLTDWMIDSDEDERRYAEVARILIEHGADPAIPAYNGSELIETFPHQYYPRLHQILTTAKKSRAEQAAP